MKRLSNEVRIGIIALVTIAAFIWLYNFLKGSELFTSSDSYYIIYNEISGLEESSPVEINGYQAGIVQNIKYINDGTGRLAVTITIDKDYDLPLGTQAEITTATLIAGMKIILRFGEGPGIYNNHDTIEGYVAASIIDRLGESLSPLEGNLKNIVIKLDSVVTGLNALITPQFTADIQSTVSNVNGITSNFREISEKEKGTLMAAIEDMRKFTGMLSANSSAMDATLKNLSAVSDTLANSNLSASLASLKGSLASLDTLLRGISGGEGTAGKLATDDSLYINLSNSLNSLDLLLQDMKDHPKKYVHFSVFGRKDK